MYKENNKIYTESPKWVSNMIRLGYEWERDRTPWKRRVGIISMPCKSVSAPLIALGVIRKDLERGNANNLYGHFDSLRRGRDNYLSDPKFHSGILINNSNSRTKKCLFFGGGSDEISVIDASYKGEIKRKGKLIPNPNGPCIDFITEANSKSWRMENQSIVETENIDSQLNQENYLQLLGCDGDINKENLTRSYNGILLIGDGEGIDTKYMQDIYSVSLSGNTASLGKQLTLHSRSNEISRMDFCNLQKINLQQDSYYLVVADGSSAFVKSLSHFRNSDVIGVFSRDEPVQNIEIISSKLVEIKRFYTAIKNDIFNASFANSFSAFFMEGR
jgi:hypothetical protein